MSRNSRQLPALLVMHGLPPPTNIAVFMPFGRRVVSVLDSGAEGPGFKSQPRRCRVTVLGKLFTPSVHQAAKLVAALLRVPTVTAGLAESNGSLPPTHVTCRLTAMNRDQLRNPTLGNRVWATFYATPSVIFSADYHIRPSFF